MGIVISQSRVQGDAERRARRLLVVCAACAFLVGLDSLVVSPLVPAITSATHTAIDIGGLLVTAYAVVYAVTGPLFGPVSDRWGRKRMILAGLTVFAIGTALTGVGSSFALITLCRGLAGLGAAMMMPSVFAAVSDAFPPQRRGSAIGVVVGTLMASSVVGVPLGAFAADAVSWRTTFWGIAFLTFLVLLAAAAAIPFAPPARQLPVGPVRAYLGQFRTALSNPSVLFVLLSTLLWWAGNQGMFANVGVFYARSFGLSTAQIGVVMLVAGLAGLAGNVLGGRLADRVGKRVVIGTAGVGSAVAVLALTSLTSALIPAVAAQVLWVLVFGLCQASLTTLVSELTPQARGTALTLNSSAQYGG